MKRIITLLLFSFIAYSSFSQLNMTYIGDITYNEALSDIWGYAAPDSTEYGIVGLFNGVSVVSLADPANPTQADYVDGIGSTWRDIKTWENFAYVINESGNGLAVIDLSTLPDSVSSYDWAPNIPGFGTLSTCHNIYIDEFGFAYIAGCNLNSGGVLILNVDTPTGEPEFVAAMPSVYSHDIYVRNNIAYSSEINIGQFSIYDVSDKDNIQTLGEQNTPFNFTHNSWPSDDETILFTTDEQANAPVASYDISDPGNIQELDQFRPYETLGDGVIPHNVHVWNDWLIISYYTDGCILVDGSRPENLVEVGNFDTFIPASTGFSGAWGAYPFLPSGLVLVSDIGNGMYVLEPNYVRACWLEGNITDASNNNAIVGASVELISTNVFEESNASGDYKTGFATSGTYDVLVKKPGFEPFTGSAVLENDVITTLNVALTPLVSFSVSGTVVDADGGAGISNAKVNISNDDFSYDIETDANGNFQIAAFFGGDYSTYAGKWGYSTNGIENVAIDENNASLIIEIEEGYQDPFQLDLGWTVNGTTALFGGFERGIPIGTFQPQAGYFINPENDIPDDVGNQCYVTVNGPDFFEHSLYNGATNITSPSFDLSSYNEPMISYQTFLWSADFSDMNNPVAGTGSLIVNLNNGFTEVATHVLSYDDLMVTPDWNYYEVNVLDFLGASIDSLSDLQIIFRANSNGQTQLSEMGVDDFVVWDANPTGAKELLTTLEFVATPNLSTTDFSILYELEHFDSDTQLLIYNELGQIVNSFELNDQLGSISFGNKLSSGVYFAHIVQDKVPSRTIRLVKL